MHATNILLQLCVLLAALTPVVTPQVLSTTVHLANWGISDPADIRLAQFSIVHSPGQQLLNLHAAYRTGFFLDVQVPLKNADCIPLADFDDAFVNLFGGSYHAFQSGSSTASLIHSLDRTGNHTLRLIYSKGADGYCGFWMHTFNSAAPVNERTYFNAAQFSHLLITLKGSTGREQLMLKAADEVWNAKEDALPVGSISGFLPRGRIDTVWQTAVIPISAFPKRLNTSRLATIAFEVVGSDSGTLEFSSVSFCAGMEGAVQQPLSFVTGSSSAKTERAVWVWNTRDFIRSRQKLQELRTFLQSHSIEHVFLALPFDSDHPEARNGVPINQTELAPVVRALNASGLKVHALTGDKDFVKPEHRTFVRTTMQNIVRYQQTVEPAAQFYGIHLDIEPYLLPGFGSERQSWFLQNLLEVFAECATQARSARLVIGADIPAWLDAPDELTHRRKDILRDGTTKPAYQHIVDLLDFVVLMDYRTRAAGEGGIIAQAANELRYAVETGKQVFVGLETVPLLDETLMVIRGEPGRGIPNEGGKKVYVFARNDSVTFALLDAQSLPELLKRNNMRPDDLTWWSVSRETTVPASRLTFAQQEGKLKFLSAMQNSEALLRLFPSFAGFAFHDYEGMKVLFGR